MKLFAYFILKVSKNILKKGKKEKKKKKDPNKSMALLEVKIHNLSLNYYFLLLLLLIFSLSDIQGFKNRRLFPKLSTTKGISVNAKLLHVLRTTVK